MHLPIQYQTLPERTVSKAQPSSAAVESSHHPSGERVDSSGPGGDVPMEVAQAVEPTTKSHAPVEEHDQSLVPKRQKGTAGQVRDHPNTQLDVQAAMDAATDT